MYSSKLPSLKQNSGFVGARVSIPALITRCRDVRFAFILPFWLRQVRQSLDLANYLVHRFLVLRFPWSSLDVVSPQGAKCVCATFRPRMEHPHVFSFKWRPCVVKS